MTDPRFAQLPERVERLGKKVEAFSASVDARFDAVDVRFDTVDARFGAVDEAFAEQRPYTEFAFEALRREVLSEFGTLRTEMKGGFNQLQSNFNELQSNFQRIERKLEQLIDVSRGSDAAALTSARVAL